MRTDTYRRLGIRIDPPDAYANEKSRLSNDSEARAGTEEATRLLQALRGSEPGTYLDSPQKILLQLADAAEARHDNAEDSRLRLLSQVADHTALVTRVDRMNDRLHGRVALASEGAIDEDELRKELKEAKKHLFPYNESLKTYLDTHPSTTVGRTEALLWTVARATGDDQYPGVFTPAARGRIRDSIVGMRGELSAEQILGKFEGVDIDYALTDDLETRRELEQKGVDYKISVFVPDLETTFDIFVDIKCGQKKTVGRNNQPLWGKLWNQCTRNDYPNDGVRLDARTIMQKVLPMQQALLEQIRIQNYQEFQYQCDVHGVKFEDLYID